MPIIPQLQEQQRMEASSPVAISGTGDARIAGDAISSVGKGLTEFGAAWNRAYLQTERTKGSLEVDNAYSEALIHAQQTGSPDGADFRQKVKEYADKKLETIKDNYSGVGVGDWLDQYRAKVAQNADEHALKQGYVRQQNWVVDQNKNIIDSFADRARQFPENAGLEFKGFLNGHLAQMRDSGVLSPESYSKIEDIARKKIATSYIDGLVEKKQYSTAAQQLGATEQLGQIQLSEQETRDLGLPSGTKLNMITKKGAELSPETSELMRSLDPQQKSHYLQRIQNELEQSSRVKLKTITDHIGAVSYFNLSGRPVDPVEMQKAQGLIASAPPEVQPYLRDKLETSKMLAPLAQNALKMTPDQIRNEINAIHSQVMNRPGELSMKEDREKSLLTFERSMEDMISRRAKDPASFTFNTTPEMGVLYKGTKDGNPQASQDYATQALQIQKAQGISAMDQKVLPNDDAVSLGKKIQAAQALGGDIANEQLKALQQQWGPYYPKVIAEIQDSNKTIGEEVLTAAQIPSDESRIRILDTMKNKKVYDEAFQNNFPKSSKEALTIDIQEQFTRVRSGLRTLGTGPANTATQERFYVLAETEAKRLMVEKGLNSYQAAKQATDTIFNNNFSNIEVGKHAVLMPKFSLHDEKFTTNFLKTYGDFSTDFQGKVDALNIKIPGKLTPEQFQSRLQADSQWMTLPNQTGMGLYIRDSGQMLPVLDRQGQPVQKSFYDITRSNDSRILKGQ